MNKKKKIALILAIVFFALAVIVTGYLLLRGHNVVVLNPEGPIANEQRNLFIFTAVLSLIIVIPVFVMTFFIVWKYRVGNKKSRKAKYDPDWDHSKTAEAIWWLVPLALITILAVITWVSSHQLDPYRPIESQKKPLTVQVIALEWKWLFLYPEQHIATVNYMQVPEKTPVNFEITGDAPMNSFWIPQLGGQVYAMAGMQTKLHLEASKRGEYQGSSANISGEGFAGMKFTIKATSEADFAAWSRASRQLPDTLTMEAYAQLAKKSKDNPPAVYGSYDQTLYDTVIMKYMMPGVHGAERNHSPQPHEPHKPQDMDMNTHEGMEHGY